MLRLATTGEATATCGSFASTPATEAGTGAPPRAEIKLAFAGCTIVSAPMPLVSAREFERIPSIMPTIERIMTTSTATASMVITVRMGR